MGQNPEALGSTVPLQGGASATPPPPVVATAPVGYVQGCKLFWVSVTQVSINIGLVRSSDDTFNIVVSAPLTADITVAGANGLDVGVEAAGTWYAVYVIADSTGGNPVASLLSVSFVAPTLPAGYDKFRRVGCVRNSAASDFLTFIQVWNTSTRRYWYDTNALGPTSTQVLTLGSALAFTNILLSAFVPPTSINVILHTLLLSFGGTTVLILRPGGSTVGGSMWEIDAFRGAPDPAAGQELSQIDMPCNTAQIVQYALVPGGQTSIWVQGFDDEI